MILKLDRLGQCVNTQVHFVCGLQKQASHQFKKCIDIIDSISAAGSCLFHVIRLVELESGFNNALRRTGLNIAHQLGRKARKMNKSKIQFANSDQAIDAVENLGVSVLGLYRWIPVAGYVQRHRYDYSSMLTKTCPALLILLEIAKFTPEHNSSPLSEINC